MAKIMLVEDDKSLREIYSIRLVAEGYEVVSAGDGEEALALAVQSRPDLVISDVMMPKISGFDMLDILRSTPETKDIKVIMMTALSSEDQRQRGEALGADKYLVKSQVGIEDVINAVHEVLNDKGTTSGESSSSEDALLSRGTESTAPSATPSSSNIPPAEVSSTLQGGAPAEASIPTVPTAATPEATTPAPAPSAAPAATPEVPAPAAPQSSTAEAMEQLLNSTPDTVNATWPGNATK